MVEMLGGADVANSLSNGVFGVEVDITEPLLSEFCRFVNELCCRLI
jgi:hypothetical protein